MNRGNCIIILEENWYLNQWYLSYSMAFDSIWAELVYNLISLVRTSYTIAAIGLDVPKTKISSITLFTIRVIKERPMPKSDWVVVDTVNGSLNAEILRGLLQAQGIEVLLSQEGAGRALGLEVGLMGDIDILVNSDDVPEARKLIDDYYSGMHSTEEDSE
jgi:hypothetical protein